MCLRSGIMVRQWANERADQARRLSLASDYTHHMTSLDHDPQERRATGCPIAEFITIFCSLRTSSSA